MNNVSFKIDGMHCTGCAQTIQALLERSTGVYKVSASFGGKEARVLFDPAATSEADLASVIEKAGFRVVERSAS